MLIFMVQGKIINLSQWQEGLLGLNVPLFVECLPTISGSLGLIPAPNDQICWFEPIIPALQNWRQRDHKLKIILNYIGVGIGGQPKLGAFLKQTNKQQKHSLYVSVIKLLPKVKFSDKRSKYLRHSNHVSLKKKNHKSTIFLKCLPFLKTQDCETTFQIFFLLLHENVSWDYWCACITVKQSSLLLFRHFPYPQSSHSAQSFHKLQRKVSLTLHLNTLMRHLNKRLFLFIFKDMSVLTLIYSVRKIIKNITFNKMNLPWETKWSLNMSVCTKILKFLSLSFHFNLVCWKKNSS